MTITLSRATLLLAHLIAIIFSNIVIADDTNTFQQGKESFNNHRYRSAIESFQRLIDRGDDRATVYYNLGVSEYKLELYTQAEKHFKHILSSPEFADLASYNIGLIHTKLGSYDQAKSWFNKVNKNTNSVLYQHARAMIDKIDNTSHAGSDSDKAKGIVMLALGSDSNVNLVSDGSPTNLNDTFYNTYVSGTIPLGSSTDGVFISASHYAIRYSDLVANDFSLIRANIGYKLSADNWQTKSTLSYASSDLSGIAYQDSLRLKIEARLRLPENSVLKIAYTLDDIRASNLTYSYLDGTRHQFNFAYKLRLSDIRLETRYLLEINSRDDLPSQSYSPTRHTIRGIATKSITEAWTIGADFSYRNSHYPDATPGSGRSENRYLFSLLARYNLTSDWTLETKLQNTINNSDDAIYEYGRKEISLNTSYLF